MKTTQRSLELLLLFCALTLGRVGLAHGSWEIAVMFLGAGESPEYQRDIDRNLMELADLRPGPALRLSLFREFSDRAVQYFPDPQSAELHPLAALLSEATHAVEIAGPMEIVPRADGDVSVLQQPASLAGFLRRAFSVPGAKRLLIVYGHGLGYEGMQVTPLTALRSSLTAALPVRAGKPLDILWLDACFMASVEVAHELTPLTARLMASEEAEFSAGAPFDTLQDLLSGGPDDIDAVTRGLSERFLESYSFLREGSQTGAVYKSSATISVVDTDRLSRLLPRLNALSRQLAGLGEGWKQSVARRLPRIQMEKPELVDFGSLLLDLKGLRIVSTAAGSPLRDLITAFEIGKKGKLKTNPRILARPPRQNSLLVYGYEQWTRGFEGDDDIVDILPPSLKPVGFTPGPHENEKRWPYRTVRSRLYLTPFTVGLRHFHFFFVDPQTLLPLSRPVSHVRHSDYVLFAAENDPNPIRYGGYTQGIGKSAEKYSGLNIAEPTRGVPSLDYLDLDFYRATRWTEF